MEMSGCMKKLMTDCNKKMTTDNCPICGEENKCLVGTVEQSNCWCNNAGRFPNGVFELVPEESQGKHCICKKCVDLYKQGI